MRIRKTEASALPADGLVHTAELQNAQSGPVEQVYSSRQRHLVFIKSDAPQQTIS